MSETISDTMMAAVAEAPGLPLSVREMPTPRPGRGQFLVKMESCGVCHSDLHLRDGDENLPEESYPLIFGHEGIGRIVELGPGTESQLSIGNRVGLPWLYSTCADCPPCLTGRENFCPQQSARGVHHHGAFAEFALLEARYACEIPDAIDPVQAAPLLCAGLTAWSSLKKTRLEPGSNVLIVGVGGLGQFAIAIAKARGARVFAMDRDQTKLEEAKRLGADMTFLAGPDAGPGIRDAGGADISLNFAPTTAAWKTIETAANPMSDVVAVALVHETVDLSMMWLIDGGHRVFGSSVGTRQELRDFIRFAKQYPMPVEVESVTLSQVNVALDRLKSGDVKGRLCVDFSKGVG